MIRSVCLLSLLYSILFFSPTYGQKAVSISYYGNTSKVEFTKRFLRKSTIGIGDNNNYFNVSYVSDTFYIPKLNSIQSSSFANERYIKVKYVLKNKCYYGIFPNILVDDLSVQNLQIYKGKRKISFVGLFEMPWFNSGYGMKLTIRRIDDVTPHPPIVTIRLIKCSRYNGEFDNGLEYYLDNRNIKPSAGVDPSSGSD